MAMNDLVQHLRQACDEYGYCAGSLAGDAADEIERLRAELAEAMAYLAKPRQPVWRMTDDEIAAMASTLESVRSVPPLIGEDHWPAVERAFLDIARLFAAQQISPVSAVKRMTEADVDEVCRNLTRTIAREDEDELRAHLMQFVSK